MLQTFISEFQVKVTKTEKTCEIREAISDGYELVHIFQDVH